MTLGSNEVYFGKGGDGAYLTNLNSAQVRIGKANGTRVDIGALTNVLDQTSILQIGAAGSTNSTNKSGFIKATQTATGTSNEWNMSFHTYNGTDHVEAIRIDPNGSVNFTSSAGITNLVASGPVILGAADGANPVGDTTILGDLAVSGNFTYTGSSAIGVNSLAIINAANSGLNLSLNGPGGTVVLTADVATDNEIPLATEVASWNTLLTDGPATLATARNLWGSTFDGSANVSGPLSGVTSISSNNTVNLELTSGTTGLIKMQQDEGKYHFRSRLPATNNLFGILYFPILTASDKTYTFPDKNGTVAMISDIPSLGLGTVNTWTAIQNFNGGLTGSLTGTASNASALNNHGESTDNAAGKIVRRDASGNFAAGTITAALSGNATTASTLANTVTVGGVNFNGGSNINLPGVNAAGSQDTSGNATTATTATNCSRSVTAGDGLTGGGLLGQNRTLNVVGGNGIDANANNIELSLDQRFASASDVYLGTNTAYIKMQSTTSTKYAKIYLESKEEFRLTEGGDGLFNGDVTAFSTTIASDIKFKTEINTIRDALSIVKELRGVRYTWKQDTPKAGEREVGLIAQEVQEVVPEVVSEVSTLNTEDETHLTVDYNKLVGVLIEAIKELSLKVEELEK